MTAAQVADSASQAKGTTRRTVDRRSGSGGCWFVVTVIWYDPTDSVTPSQHSRWLARTVPDAFLIERHALGHGSTGDPTDDRTAMDTWLVGGGGVAG